ncbi:FHA domain-containing protein [Thermomonas sp. S9]|uniref:FHA domain-containing protein n=1 Tax=Thermomonas sp. S9 TaxID=2885203 RepID=UPI00216B401F|nr:FHA domain-containing protein [Thermomonas sp. S9]MCR6496702.1 FHA domain-containing protein [Thermomonas sp. S9]
MKLVFPGGEHAPCLLESDVTTIGSDPGSGIVLEQPGVLPQHCALQMTGGRVLLQVMPDAAVSVNARPVQGLIALRPGDQLDIAGVQVRLAAMPAPVVARNREAAPAVDSQGSVEDAGLTRVRPVLPRFVLRGVSGSMLGRSHPLVGVATVGRAPECTLQIEDAGLSRQHARLVPVADGVQIEDAGSTNGTFLNGRRILQGLAVAGDEIGFDTVRFRLLDSTRSELQQLAPRAAGFRMPLWWWVAAAAALAALAWVVFWLR